jgi:hypothetical protein
MGEKLRIMIANLVNSVIHLYEETEETAQMFYNRKVSKNLYLFPPLPQNFCRISHEVHFFSLKPHQQSTTLFTQTSPAKYNSFHSNITSKVQLFLFKIAKKFCGGCLAVPARFTIFALESSEKCCPTTQNQTL